MQPSQPYPSDSYPSEPPDAPFYALPPTSDSPARVTRSSASASPFLSRQRRRRLPLDPTRPVIFFTYIAEIDEPCEGKCVISMPLEWVRHESLMLFGRHSDGECHYDLYVRRPHADGAVESVRLDPRSCVAEAVTAAYPPDNAPSGGYGPLFPGILVFELRRRYHIDATLEHVSYDELVERLRQYWLTFTPHTPEAARL